MAIQLTQEQFQEFLRAHQPAAANGKNFTHCTARFGGTRSAPKVEEFITTASIYKDLDGVSDENALRGLPLLLTDEASQWWNGVKHQVQTWEEATDLIRRAYAPAKPNFRLFQEIFGMPQPEHMPIDRYITAQRHLFARLSRRLEESWQIDILFGLIRAGLRNRLKREEIHSFDDLLTRARAIEGVLWEERNDAKPRNSGSNTEETKERCNYCRNLGHAASECRKRQREEAHRRQTPAPRTSGIACYGCNTLGVFRRNCPRCNAAAATATPATTTTNSVAFCAVHPVRIKPRSRPAVNITIAGTRGIALLDTAAGASVASISLYRHMLKTGHKTMMETVDAALADGQRKTLSVPTVHTNVVLGTRTIPTTFIALSENERTKTLLGADFIEDAGLVIDLAGKSHTRLSRLFKRMT